MKKGIRTLKKVKKLPPQVANKVAVDMLAAALDDQDGVFQGMHSEMIADAMAFLGSIPSDRCATCKRPIFIHEATRIGNDCFCENCGQAERAKTTPPTSSATE